jgi:hypothetical protein
VIWCKVLEILNNRKRIKVKGVSQPRILKKQMLLIARLRDKMNAKTIKTKYTCDMLTILLKDKL